MSLVDGHVKHDNYILTTTGNLLLNAGRKRGINQDFNLLMGYIVPTIGYMHESKQSSDHTFISTIYVCGIATSAKMAL